MIQSLFLTWRGVGPDHDEIEAWCGRLRDLVAGGGRVDLVQVYTVSRPPADKTIGALPPDHLEAIAARARALGLRAEVFG
ncbi:MAG: hypothetical protein DMF79_08635 [Acidobacteria bacterium]|nr:MAG: hypothetical protein DMF79_08635 [Acidobacteriota bacterium]